MINCNNVLHDQHVGVNDSMDDQCENINLLIDKFWNWLNADILLIRLKFVLLMSFIGSPIVIIHNTDVNFW